jgi:hypothetical protein
LTIRQRLAQLLFADTIKEMVQQRLAAVSIRVDDSPGWESITRGGPADRPWADVYSDLEDTLEAWRKNFFVRRLVTLTRSYAVAGGITISSDVPEVNAFIQAFWTHQQNLMDRRVGPICDELTRAGEIFPVLFTNKVDGMSYIRFVPAYRIRQIETDPDDYETELRYAETLDTTAEPRWWIGPGHPRAFRPAVCDEGANCQGGSELPPLMLHFAVNKPMGATRGESDLLPILPWAKRYSEWLKDRVRLNRIRTRQAILHLKIADPALVEQKRQQIRTDNPIEKGIYVSGPDEEIDLKSLSIQAGDAEDDGKALRLAIAAGGNVGLHYLGEGETVNYATAKEMGEPTARFYADRQQNLINTLKDLTAAAYRRWTVITGAPWTGQQALQLHATAAEVARADNESLATAARNIVQALTNMRANGWIDDETAATLALKFAGEPLAREEIARILANAEPIADKTPAVSAEGGNRQAEQSSAVIASSSRETRDFIPRAEGLHPEKRGTAKQSPPVTNQEGAHATPPPAPEDPANE